MTKLRLPSSRPRRQDSSRPRELGPICALLSASSHRTGPSIFRRSRTTSAENWLIKDRGCKCQRSISPEIARLSPRAIEQRGLRLCHPRCAGDFRRSDADVWPGPPRGFGRERPVWLQPSSGGCEQFPRRVREDPRLLSLGCRLRVGAARQVRGLSAPRPCRSG